MAIVDLILSVILTAAAALGAGVAALGLRTWRKQLQGRTEYELARRLLRAVYQVRDDLAYARGRVIHGSELASAVEELQIDASELEPGDSRALAVARARRWNHVEQSLSALRVEELEAEVLWGQEAKEVLTALRACVSRINSTLAEYGATFDGNEVPASREERERYVQLRRILYGSGGSDDDFAQEVEVAVAAVEGFVRPYLKL